MSVQITELEDLAQTVKQLGDALTLVHKESQLGVDMGSRLMALVARIAEQVAVIGERVIHLEDRIEMIERNSG